MLVKDLKPGKVYKQVVHGDWSPILYLGTENSEFGVLYLFTRLDRYNSNKPLWDIMLYEDRVNDEVIE